MSLSWNDLKIDERIIVEVASHGTNGVRKNFAIGKRYPAIFKGPATSYAEHGYRIKIRHQERGLFTKVFVTKRSTVLGAGNWKVVARMNTDTWEAPNER